MDPHEPGELQYLIDLALADEVTEPQRTRLNELLRTSDQAMRLYADQLGMHAALAFRSTSKPFAAIADQAKIDAAKSPPFDNAALAAFQVSSSAIPVLRSLGRSSAGRTRPILWSILAVAAAFYGTFTLLSWNLRSGVRPDDMAGTTPAQRVATKAPATAEPVARIVDQLKAEFADNRTPSKGAGLRAGEELDLHAGLIEIAFSDGARVVLQGPAKLTINSSRQGRLNLGKLVAHVPPPAIGFAIETPTARIVDLGTEFAAEVGSDGQSGVHVLSGLVSVSNANGSNALGGNSKPIQLRAGQSVAIAQADSRPLTAINSPPDARRFVRRLQAISAQLPVIGFSPSMGNDAYSGVHLRLVSGSTLEHQGLSAQATRKDDGALRVINGGKSFVDLDCSIRGPFADSGLIDQGRIGRDGTTIYVSWLTRCERPHEQAYAGVSFMLFGDTGVSADERLFVGKPFKAPTFGADLLTGSYLPLDADPQTEDVQPIAVDEETHRFVVRMRFRVGPDEIAVFIDPAGSEKTAVPNSLVVADAAFDRMRFAVGDNTENQDGACWWFDDLRFGQNWQSVLPNN